MRAALLKRKLREFVESIQADDRLAIVHHRDADGVCSAAVTAFAVKKLAGKDVDLVLPTGYTDKELREDICPALRKHGITKAFSLDLAIDYNPVFVQECSHIAYCVIDHHKVFRDLTAKNVLFIKAQFLSGLDGSKYPASKLVYDLFSDLTDLSPMSWVSAIGVLGDRGLKQWRPFLEDAASEHQTTIESLQKLTDMVNAVEALAPGRFVELFRALGKTTPGELLKHEFMQFDAKLKDEVKRLTGLMDREGEFHPELELVFYSFRSPYEVKSALANELSVNYCPGQTLILFHDKGDDVLRFSARRQDFKVKINDLLEYAVRDLPYASAGGHVPAAAGRIQRGDLARFKQRVIEYLKKNSVSQLQVGAAEERDLGEVLRIEQLVFEPCKQESREVYADRLKTYPAGFRKAQLSDQIIGFLSSEKWAKQGLPRLNQPASKLHDSDGKIFVITSLAVLPAFAGHGIGNALVKDALAIAQRESCTHVLVSVDTTRKAAAALYRRWHFQPGKKYSVTCPQGKTCKEQLYVKTL